VAKRTTEVEREKVKRGYQGDSIDTWIEKNNFVEEHKYLGMTSKD
jgi:hypothetical protein